jgi:hypothetical protein
MKSTTSAHDRVLILVNNADLACHILTLNDRSDGCSFNEAADHGTNYREASPRRSSLEDKGGEKMIEKILRDMY